MTWLIYVLWVGIPVVIALIFGAIGVVCGLGYEHRSHDKYGCGHGTRFPSVFDHIKGFMIGFTAGGIFGCIVAYIVTMIMKWCGWF